MKHLIYFSIKPILLPETSNMTFHREINVNLNFNEDTFHNSEPYKQFVKDYPKLKDTIDNSINEFIDWAMLPCGKIDYCYSHNTKLPIDDTWNTSNYGACSFDEFKKQMGTSREKFSISETIDNGNGIDKLIGNVFEKIGFKTFLAVFKMFILGCDYKFVKLSDVSNEDTDDENEYDDVYVHVCVSV
jgi:hypothetical protein